MDLDTGETTLNISNSVLICDVSGQLVMTTVIILLWLNGSQRIFSVLILYSTTTSSPFAPPSHCKTQFLHTLGWYVLCEICYACNCSITEFYFPTFAFVSQLQGSFFLMLPLHSVFNKTFLARRIVVLLCESVPCGAICCILSGLPSRRKSLRTAHLWRELRGRTVWWGLKHERPRNRPA